MKSIGILPHNLLWNNPSQNLIPHIVLSHKMTKQIGMGKLSP